jgi:large subunit ribosomal protein L40
VKTPKRTLNAAYSSTRVIKLKNFMSLLASSRPRLLCHSLQITVRYARKEAQGDPKQDVLRRVLYPNNLKARSTPTGAWRPEVARALQIAIPSNQAHETIERTWSLHQRRLREKHEAELKRKLECVKKAMDELERVDMFLFLGANKVEDPREASESELQLLKKFTGTERRVLQARIRGLFPRELRLPTDTPSRDGWNYEWKPFPRPL